MPTVEFKEFEQCKAQGYKGTFVGGCVERGDGSSFRRKAHAHCYDKDPHQGWICVRSPKRLYDSAGNASLLMWHEMAHIITKDGHGRKFYMWLRDHSTIRKKEERISQWAYLCRHYKDPVRAYAKIKGRKGECNMESKKDIVAGQAVPETPAEAKLDPAQLTNDPNVKRMGPAKEGGTWFRNVKSSTLYRVDNVEGKPAIVETKKIAEKASGKVKAKEPAKKAVKVAPEAKGDSRAALMMQAKAKGYKYYRLLSKDSLRRILDPKCTADERDKIIEDTKKRWQESPFFQKKADK